MSETDISNEPQNSLSSTDSIEEKLRNRLYELAMKMSEKETSSGEDQESESKAERKNQKGSLSSEENNQGVQEELKKVRARRCLLWRGPPQLQWGRAVCRHALGPRKLSPQCSAQVLGRREENFISHCQRQSRKGPHYSWMLSHHVSCGPLSLSLPFHDLPCFPCCYPIPLLWLMV